MIEPKQGDLLSAETEAIVNAVNCAGVMGKGIALQVRRKYPAVYREYKRACKQGRVEPGRMLTIPSGDATPRYIVNFPTKAHWSEPSRMEYIDQGLEALVREVRDLGIASIAIPALGCGLGGLEWSEVEPRIRAAFAGMEDVTVLLYGPQAAPEADKMGRADEGTTQGA